MDRLRVLILDFDGVVIESNAVKTEAFRHVFSRFPEHTDAMMAYHHANVSVSRFDKFKFLMTKMGLATDSLLIDEISAEFSKRVLGRMITVPLVAGAETFICKAAREVPVYLASITPEAELAQILASRGLSRWFRNVYGCPPWTKPDAIHDVLRRENVKPSDVLLIGDSAGDQRAAQNTGVNFLARDSGLDFDLPLPFCFSDLNEISDYLNGMLG